VNLRNIFKQNEKNHVNVYNRKTSSDFSLEVPVSKGFFYIRKGYGTVTLPMMYFKSIRDFGEGAHIYYVDILRQIWEINKISSNLALKLILSSKILKGREK